MLASGAAYVPSDDPDHPDVYFRADATAQFGLRVRLTTATHMLRLCSTERGG